MIPILYDTILDAFGGSWTEKKGSSDVYYYWNCETSTASKQSTTSSYTAWDPISVTPGKVYHLQTRRGTWAKQKPLLFVDANYVIINSYSSTVQAMDVYVTAPAGAVYALITTSSISTANRNAVSFKEFVPGGPVSNGLGRLGGCTRCLVTEERNGKYEVEFDIPITDKYYSLIDKDKIISVTHDENGDRQPFRIYRKSAPINGIVTFNAHHISYDLCNIIVQPFTATSITDAFDQLKRKVFNQNDFTFWTDSISSGDFEVEVPSSVRSLLGGQRGSILDVYGGEYEFDNMIVRNYAHRGNDNGVSILYGKNLTDIEDTSDNGDTYNAVVPYWMSTEGDVVFGGIVGQDGAATYKVVSLDFSSEFEEAPTVAQLETKAASYLTANTPWIPKENIKINFVALWQTEEYKNYAPLERVKLCDTVHVKYGALGVNATAKVIKVVWNALAEKYDSIELGEARSSFAETIISKSDQDFRAALKPYAKTSMMDEAINHATALITGGLGGYIKFKYDANDNPTEMLIMDHDTEAAAVNILRINVNGIGFSSDGGTTFSSAWTLDGQFVADWITAGHLSCDRIQGGTLTLGGSSNGNGVIRVYNASGTEIGSWTKDGLTATGALKISQHFNDSSWPGTAGRTFNIYADKIPMVVFPYPRSSNPSGYTNEVGMVVEEEGSNKMIITNDEIFRDQSVQIRACGTSLYEQGVINVSSAHIQFWFNGVNSNIASILDLVRDYTNNKNYIYMYADKAYYHASEIAVVGSSSKRYKHDISDKLDSDLNPERLYKLKIKQFIFNDGHPLQYADMKGKTLPGFIAEDVEEIYPAAVIHDRDGNVENWDERRIIPGMLALIQQQKKQLDEQEIRIKKLEEAVEALQEARHE